MVFSIAFGTYLFLLTLGYLFIRGASLLESPEPPLANFEMGLLQPI